MTVMGYGGTDQGEGAGMYPTSASGAQRGPDLHPTPSGRVCALAYDIAKTCMNKGFWTSAKPCKPYPKNIQLTASLV